MASDLIESSTPERGDEEQGSNRRECLYGGGSAVASLGARGASRAGTPRRLPCHLFRTGRNGWLEGVRLAQQHKR